MQFHNPYLLLHLLWILPLLGLLVYGGVHWRRKRLSVWIADPAIARDLCANLSPARRRWRLLLLVYGLIFLVLALARPQWGSKLIKQPAHSRDVLVVLDVSRSMLARDVPPSRLLHAKHLISTIVASCPGDRFGLVDFAGAAFLECPLTQNLSGFQLFLQNADTDSIPVGGTNIEAALDMALKALKAAEGNHQAVLLITDGDELQGDVQKCVGEYQQRHIPIFVVGIGDPTLGSYIQLPDNTFVTDQNGERVKSKLNEKGLQAISSAVGGTYVHSTVTYDGSAHLIQKINALIPDNQAAETTMRPIERYQIPLLLGLLCLLLRLGLGERKVAPGKLTGGSVAALVLVALLLAPVARVRAEQPPPMPPPGSLSPVHQPDTQGQAAAPQPQPASPQLSPQQQARLQMQVSAAKAVEFYTDKLAKAKTNVEKAFYHFNLGQAYQQEDQTEKATNEYDQAIDLAGPAREIKAAAYQNLGVIKHRQALQELMQKPDDAIKHLDDARNSYREALRYADQRDAIAKDEELAIRHQELARQVQQMQQQNQQQANDAKQKAEDAAKAQQEANDEQNPQQKQQQQQQAEAKNQAAQKSVKDLADAADKSGQKQAAEHLKDIAKQMQDAEQDQQQAQDRKQSSEQRDQAGKEAEEKLAKAAEQLGSKQEGKQQQGQEQEAKAEQGKPGDKDEGKDKGKEDMAVDKAPPKPQQAQEQTPTMAQQGQDEGKSFDKQQALGILDTMQQEDRDLNKVMKQHMKQQSKLQEPDKNW